MIFFIVPIGEKKTYVSVKSPQKDALEWDTSGWNDLHTSGNYRIIPWNLVEGWSDPDAFLRDVLLAAQQDVVCRTMRVMSMKRFGLEPFSLDPQQPLPPETFEERTEKQSARGLVHKLFYHWCNPMTGNIGNTPRPRPSTSTDQLDALMNWKSKLKTQPAKKVLDEEDRTTIKSLMNTMSKRLEDLADDEMERTRRDQVKTFHNVTEAARAFIGEVTTTIPKYVEKIFALRLAQSDELWKAQREILGAFLKKIAKEDWDALINAPWEKFEYLYPFLNPSLGASGSQPPPPDFIDALVVSAFGTADLEGYKTEPFFEALMAWEEFPPTARCTMLLNAIRKLDDAAQEKKHGHPPRTPQTTRARMSILDLAQLKPDAFEGKPQFASLPSYKVVWAAPPRTHVPEDIELLRTWNRNEYDVTEITYRVYLCPTWAGNSGHTAEALRFWLGALGHAAPPHTARTITCSLFMFWRLFYDKRITPVHTLVDTLEATFNKEVIIGESNHAPKKRQDHPKEKLQDRPSRLLDAFVFTESCVTYVSPTTGQECVDPIYLMQSLCEAMCLDKWPKVVTQCLKLWIMARYEMLKMSGYWAPRWSRSPRMPGRLFQPKL